MNFDEWYWEEYFPEGHEPNDENAEHFSEMQRCWDAAINSPAPSVQEQPVVSPQKRYYWKQCYELGTSKHWALCDTESDKQRKITSLALILYANRPELCEQPVDELPIMKLIIDLLNKDQLKKEKAG